MDDFTIRFLLTILENIAIIFTVFRLFEITYESKGRLAVFILLISLITTCSFVYIEPTFRFLLNLVVHFLLSWLILGFNLRFSLTFTSVRVFFQFVAEISFLVLIFGFNGNLFNLNDINLSLVITALIVLASILVSISNVSLKHFFNVTENINIYFSYLLYIFFGLIGVLLFTLILITNENMVFLVKISVTFNVFIIFLVLNLFNKLVDEFEKKTLQQIEGTYTRRLEDVFETFNSQRHDFINHLYILKKMVKERKIDQFNLYLDELLEEAAVIGENTPIIDNAPVAALLLTKLEVAKNKDIEFNVDSIKELPDMKIRSYELVKVVSNLIDNAMDEEQKVSPSKRTINISITTFLDSYLVIKVFNRNSYLSKIEQKKIFSKGYSLKGNNRGYGLAIVKEIITMRNGHIDIDSNKEGTSFTVFIPCNQKRS